MSEPVDPPSPTAFYGYLGVLVSLAALAVGLLYLLFISGFPMFADQFRVAPLSTVRAEPHIIGLLAVLFACLLALVTVVVVFGARIDRVEIDDGPDS